MPQQHPSPEDDPQPVIQARCPSCGSVGDFHYIGEQVWPEMVAERLGLPARMKLYQCANCRSSISEQMLVDVPDNCGK